MKIKKLVVNWRRTDESVDKVTITFGGFANAGGKRDDFTGEEVVVLDLHLWVTNSKLVKSGLNFGVDVLFSVLNKDLVCKAFFPKRDGKLEG